MGSASPSCLRASVSHAHNSLYASSNSPRERRDSSRMACRSIAAELRVSHIALCGSVDSYGASKFQGFIKGGTGGHSPPLDQTSTVSNLSSLALCRMTSLSSAMQPPASSIPSPSRVSNWPSSSATPFRNSWNVQ